MAQRASGGVVTAPIIVSAVFEPADQRWLDGLRQAHFPPERNHLAAHLTLFHHIPPSALDELLRRLSDETRDQPPPEARLCGVMDLGGGTAIRVATLGLSDIRARLADAFAPLLIPQDRAGWRPHVTIQNKVARQVAKDLQVTLGDSFDDRAVGLHGLAAWWYRGGPWELIRTFPFSRSGRRPRS